MARDKSGSLGRASKPKSVTANLTGDKTVSVRKIKNGFIIRQSSFNSSTGKFTEPETYSKAAPKLTIV